jgi:hypothetical protein
MDYSLLPQKIHESHNLTSIMHTNNGNPPNKANKENTAEKRKHRSSSSNNMMITPQLEIQSGTQQVVSQKVPPKVPPKVPQTLKKPRRNGPTQTSPIRSSNKMDISESYTLEDMSSNPNVILKLLKAYNASLSYTGDVTQDPDIFDYLSDGVQSEIN